MAKTIVWNKKAVEKFDEILDYLRTEGSDKTVQEFVRKVFDRIEILKNYPEIGRRSQKKKTIRYYKIDKNRIMYYRKYGNKLVIVYFFDTRQNPYRNPY